MTIALVDINAGTTLEERNAYASAQTVQLTQHFAPLYGFGADTVRVCTPDSPPVSGERQMRLFDKPEDPSELGFHEQLPDGTPVSNVFVGFARSLHLEWTGVASHEALEMTADPRCRLCVMMADGFWDFEVADRVEQDLYSINGQLMSNFNTPDCFQPPSNLAGVKYDYMGLSTEANEVRPGGYAQHFDPKKGWVMIQNGAMSPYRTKLAELLISRGSRRARLLPPKRSWLSRLLRF